MATPITYLLPVYWACALINDDYTGLSDEEEHQILPVSAGTEQCYERKRVALSVWILKQKAFIDTTMPVLCPETVQNTPF